MRKRASAWMAVAALAGAGAWLGCGGGDGDTTRFFGDVSSVQPSSSAMRAPAARRRFALHWPGTPATAFAQGTCTAPSSGSAPATLLFCIETSTAAGCAPVDANCDFSIETGIERDRDTVALTFVDDTNSNGRVETDEPTAALPTGLRFCNGDQVQISDVSVNFTSHLATGTIAKIVDECAGTTATATPGTTGTPAVTGTPGTPAPTASPTTTYSMASSLNEPPSSLLAFLFSAGALGLLAPRRRRK
jgi:hypothetical protein